MPTSDDRPIAIIAALILAIPFWLGACSPIPPKPSEAAAEPMPGPIAGPIPGPIAGPIPLAPSMTGTPAASPAPERSPASPAPPPALAPVAVAPAPPPAPAPVAAIPAAALSSCPPGSIALWSEPDLAGTPVSICRQLNPRR